MPNIKVGLSPLNGELYYYEQQLLNIRFRRDKCVIETFPKHTRSVEEFLDKK